MSGKEELKRAEADTVMFASARPLSPHSTVPLPTAPDATGRHGAPGSRLSRHRHDAERTAAPPRRTWVSRGVLLLIMALQTLLTLRMTNTAFEDEALYLYAGHLEIGHLLHGTALQGDYPSYFSGAPVLYPVLGALADSIGGLAAARALSLVEMLAATGLLYAMTRRLFNERVGLCAAAIFAVAEPTLFLGHLATYDASALLLLAVAAWLAVRYSASRATYLLAAPVLTLAVTVKYATLLFVPSVIMLAGLAAAPRLGRRALGTSVMLGTVTAGLLAGALYLAGPDYLAGFKFSTLDRFPGTGSTASILRDVAQWIGVPFLFAVTGAVGYAIRPLTEPGEQAAPGGSRRRRVLLGLLMAGSMLLAPAEQIRIHTETSLAKHVGFGLLLAAPIAGVGLARVLGDHFRRIQVGIPIWGASMVIGMSGASSLFGAWSNSSAFITEMTHHLQPGARYLAEVPEVPIYYLRRHANAQPRQFTSTYDIRYVTKQGKYLTGNAGYIAAIKAGYFQIVTYDYQTTPATDAVIARALLTSPDYRLTAVIPTENNTVKRYVWVKSR